MQLYLAVGRWCQAGLRCGWPLCSSCCCSSSSTGRRCTGTCPPRDAPHGSQTAGSWCWSGSDPLWYGCPAPAAAPPTAACPHAWKSPGLWTLPDPRRQLPCWPAWNATWRMWGRGGCDEALPGTGGRRSLRRWRTVSAMRPTPWRRILESGGKGEIMSGWRFVKGAIRSFEEEMLIKRERSSWLSFNIPTQTLHYIILKAEDHFWVSIILSLTLDINSEFEFVIVPLKIMFFMMRA